jgi:hypothetical protein
LGKHAAFAVGGIERIEHRPMQRAQAENFERRTHPNRPLIAGVRNAVATGVVLHGQRAERRDEIVYDRFGTIKDSACTIIGKVARGGGCWLLHTLRAVRSAPRGFMAREDCAPSAGRRGERTSDGGGCLSRGCLP